MGPDTPIRYSNQSISRILKSRGLAPELPEDLHFMVKKAVSMRKHLAINRGDKQGKYKLICLESSIHRLSRYYRKSKKVAPKWKYNAGPFFSKTPSL